MINFTVRKILLNTIFIIICAIAFQISAFSQVNRDVIITRDAKKKVISIGNLLGGYYESCSQPPKVYQGLIASVYEDVGNIESFKMRVGKKLRVISPANAPNRSNEIDIQIAKNEFLVKGKKISVTVYVCGNEWLADEMKVIK